MNKVGITSWDIIIEGEVYREVEDVNGKSS